MENKKRKCSRCKHNRPIEDFSLKLNEEYKKTCDECLVKIKKYRGKSKCEHNRRRNRCKDCGGGSICKHDKRRSQCKECGGSQICIHDRQRSRCKECSNDPLKITFKEMIGSSKKADKKYDRYDANNFIDMCFLEGLYDEFDDIPVCYYNDCKCEMQCMSYGPDLITIERLDNSIGHIKSNCVFCCFACNLAKKSNKF